MPKKASSRRGKYQTIEEWLNSDPKQEPARRNWVGQLREKSKTPDWGDLEWVHTVGRLILKLHPHTPPAEDAKRGARPKKRPYGENLFQLLADDVRPDWRQSNRALDDYLIQAWQFALTYPTRQDLRELLRVGSTAKPPRHLTWPCVCSLLRIKDAKRRRSLVLKWEKRPFSLRAWQRETQKVVAIERAAGPEKKYCGRPPRKPTSRREMAEQVRERTFAWLWWYDNFGKPFKIANARAARIGDLSEELRTKLKRAERSMRSLQGAAEAEMDEPS